MKKMKEIAIGGVCGVIAALFLASPLKASIGVSAHACTAQIDNIIPQDIKRGAAWYTDFLNFESGQELIFDCPMIRPDADDSSLTDIYLRAIDYNDDESVQCFAKSCNGTATSCSSTQVVSTGDSFNGGTNTLSLGNVTGYSHGFAWIQCSIPPTDMIGVLTYESGIRSYRFGD